MSVESMTSNILCTIKRRDQTRASTGGKGAITYTTAAREAEGLPTSGYFAIFSEKETENEKFGIRGDRLLFKSLAAWDPKLTTADILEYTDNSSTVRQIRCIHRSIDINVLGRLWKCRHEEISNED